jgi:poly(A) polymerase
MRPVEPLPMPVLTGAEKTRMNAVVSRPDVLELLALLNDEAGRTMIVGGAVRNALLDRAVVDVDLATTLRPEEVMARAQSANIKSVATGLEHGTLTLVKQGHAFEVTTLRKDIETDGRRATIAYSQSFVEDAERRDFTMNALYADHTGQVFDPVSGLADLRKGHVRFVGHAQTRIREDYLRILRFFRFFADYAQETIDPEGLAACLELKEGLGTLSRERIGHEWLKVLMARKACATITIMQQHGLLKTILPAHATVERLQHVLELFPAATPMVRLFALLWPDEQMIAHCQADLRLSNVQTKHLSDLLKALNTAPRMANDAEPHKTSWQLWAFRHGRAIAHEALALKASHDTHNKATLAAHEKLIVDLPDHSPFSGADFLALGVKAGPHLGALLQKIETLWIESGFPDDPATQKALLLDVVNQEKN